MNSIYYFLSGVDLSLTVRMIQKAVNRPNIVITNIYYKVQSFKFYRLFNFKIDTKLALLAIHSHLSYNLL